MDLRTRSPGLFAPEAIAIVVRNRHAPAFLNLTLRIDQLDGLAADHTGMAGPSALDGHATDPEEPAVGQPFPDRLAELLVHVGPAGDAYEVAWTTVQASQQLAVALVLNDFRRE